MACSTMFEKGTKNVNPVNIITIYKNTPIYTIYNMPVSNSCPQINYVQLIKFDVNNH